MRKTNEKTISKKIDSEQNKKTNTKNTSSNQTQKRNKRINSNTKSTKQNNTSRTNNKDIKNSNLKFNSITDKEKNIVIQGVDISSLENRLNELKENSSNLANDNFDINTIIHKTKKPESEKSIKTKKEKPKKHKKTNFLYDLIIAVCLISIIYSTVNIIIWQKNNIDNKKLIEEVADNTPIEKTEIVQINENLKIEKKKFDFTELLNQNPDTVGWVTVPNTEINYSVVKSTDNDFYLKHAFDKSYNAAGWIYADYRNKCDDTDQNLIIYGHNRLNNNMFGTLENTLTDEWLADSKNYYINYSSLKDSHLYEIFSIFICGGEESVNYMQTDFNSKEDFMVYLGTLRDLSYHDFNVQLSDKDKIITLYTCHGLNNQRLLVCGKLVDEPEKE